MYRGLPFLPIWRDYTYSTSQEETKNFRAGEKYVQNWKIENEFSFGGWGKGRTSRGNKAAQKLVGILL